MSINSTPYIYENENARLLAAEVLHKFLNLNPSVEISEESALSMYLFAKFGEYYTNRENHTLIPVLNIEVS